MRFIALIASHNERRFIGSCPEHLHEHGVESHLIDNGYLFLSAPHAVKKYVERRYSPEEVESGWHDWRARLTESDMPRTRHWIDSLIGAR